jgi:hypothetical protein
MGTNESSTSLKRLNSMLTKLGDIVNQGNVSNINVNIDIDTESMEVLSISIEDNNFIFSRSTRSEDSSSNHRRSLHKPGSRPRSRSNKEDTYVFLEPVSNICESISYVDKDISGDCCICLNEYKHISNVRKRVLNACNHNFCELCLIQWLKTNNRCPTCRQLSTNSLKDF